jgi:hypothetical protein
MFVADFQAEIELDTVRVQWENADTGRRLLRGCKRCRENGLFSEERLPQQNAQLKK